MNPLISIVIPVYNGEKFLRDCLDSVLKQTLENIEVIVVNDGSSDSSADIIEHYAKKDNRVIPINQENQGPETARNNGIKNSKGEFIAFLDSDDWVEPETYKEMYEAAVKSRADIVFTDIVWEYEDQEKSRIHSYSVNANRTINRDEIKEKILTDFLYSGSYGGVWKLFRRRFVESNDIKFPKGKYLGEDWLFNLEAFTYCDTVYYLNKPYYHYRQINQTSLMRKHIPNLYDSYINSDTLERYAKKWGIFNEKIEVDLARRKCYIAVNGCIQNEFKPGCKKTVKQKLDVISKIVNHQSVNKAVDISMQNEKRFSRKFYLMLIKKKMVIILFLIGKILSLRS